MNEVTPANKQQPPIVVMRQRLEARADELKAALSNDISPEKFIRAVVTSATINPDIQACSWQSLWISCMRACRDDLLPDGRQGAIVPFKDKATWIPMYQGLLLRAWRTEKFKWIGANIVREGDLWTHFIDTTGEHFRHEPKSSTGKMIAVYAAATTLDGGTFIAFIPKDEAEFIRQQSKATREDSPWNKWESEMYKKTALRRLAKMLPIDIAVEEEFDDVPAPAPRGRPRTHRSEGATAALESFAGGLKFPTGLPTRMDHRQSSKRSTALQTAKPMSAAKPTNRTAFRARPVRVNIERTII